VNATLSLLRQAVAAELGLEERAIEVKRTAWALYKSLPHFAAVGGHGYGRVSTYFERHNCVSVAPMVNHLVPAEPNEIGD
jgi:hypothetical protein